MPSIEIQFNSELNASLQIGDTAYYVPVQAQSTFSVNSDVVVVIGTITNIFDSKITCNIGIYTTPPVPGDFILFSKDNKANMSSLLGYYANVEVRNDSKTKAEMYNISADYFESSK
mgnify:CR=1 FL=1